LQLDLATLPANAIHKYLLHYGIVPPQPLDYGHAIFPPLAEPSPAEASDDQPASARTRNVRSKRGFEEDEQPPKRSSTVLTYRQLVDRPPTEELGGAPDVVQEPEAADDRLVSLATRHWHAMGTVKEGETLSAFMFKLRRCVPYWVPRVMALTPDRRARPHW
jgi:hypothetical protein